MSSDNAKRMYSNDDDKPWANPHYELPEHVVRVESLKREINQYEHVVDVLEKDVAKLEDENVTLRSQLAAAEARQRSDEQQLIDIAKVLGGDARDCTGNDKSIAGLVRERLAAAEAIAEAEDESRDYETMDLNRQLAAAEAELDTLRSRCICELADDDDEASHESGWQVCGVCWNNAAMAHRKVADMLKEKLATAHRLLKQACDPLEHDTGWCYRVACQDWITRAKKEIGDVQP